MPNYQDTIIYSIRCKTNPKFIYIAFTTTDLNTCWDRFKNLFKSGYRIGIYSFIENIEDWYFKFEMFYPCLSYSEANEGKSKVIKQYSTVNYNSRDEFVKLLYRYKAAKNKY